MKDGVPDRTQSFAISITRRRVLLISAAILLLATIVYSSYALVSAQESQEESADVPALTLPSAEEPEKTAIRRPLVDWSSIHEKRDRYFEDRTGEVGVQVDGVFADDIDPQAALVSNSIDEVQIYFKVSNSTDQHLTLLSIPTEIQQGTLTNIRVEGATGYSWIHGELVIQYVSLLPNTSIIVTVTGLPVVSSDAVTLSLSPEIRKGDVLISKKSSRINKQIEAKTSALLEQFTIVQRHVDTSKINAASSDADDAIGSQ